VKVKEENRPKKEGGQRREMNFGSYKFQLPSCDLPPPCVTKTPVGISNF